MREEEIEEIRKEGIKVGKKEIINTLLEIFSLTVVADLVKIDKREIEKIINE